ncbi:MAG: 3'-5' exonuclease [Bacteroidota bacterium]
MILNLKKPLIFIDLETTGVNVVTDRIVEYSVLKLNPDGSEEIRTQRINPTIPIPPFVSTIHGIFDKDIADCPTFIQIAKTLNAFIGNSDLAGYNSVKFDVPLLVEEFLRAGIDFDMSKRKQIDVQNIFHKLEQRTLVAAYKFYCNKELENAHSAEVDTIATYEVLKSQLEKYPDLQNDVEYLSNFSAQTKNADLMGRIVFNDKNQEVINFGKHKGRTVEDVLKIEPSYYNWMMNGEFPLSTKRVMTQIKLRGIQK